MPMVQKSIEIILFRQIAFYLNFPIVILDSAGNFIFCNEPAEKILGFRFSETGEMPAIEWTTVFVPQDKYGNPLDRNSLPVFVAQEEQRMVFDQFYIRNLQNEVKHLEVTAFPIINQMNSTLGAVAFFQEIGL